MNKHIFQDGNKVWKITSLIEASKDLKIEEMPVSAINSYSLLPKIHTMKHFVSKIKKVIRVDLKYPIILDGEGYVMDGRHRIAKAMLYNEKTIKYVRFDVTPDADYIKDDDA